MLQKIYKIYQASQDYDIQTILKRVFLPKSQIQVCILTFTRGLASITLRIHVNRIRTCCLSARVKVNSDYFKY